MSLWVRRIIGTVAITLAMFGALCVWGEGRPLAAAVETRSATMLCGMAAAILALSLRGWLRVALAMAGAALGVIAAVRYARYAAIPVVFQSDVTLSGTLYRPRGVARPPVVVLLHGSGRQTRREARHYAQLLVRNGMAALVYDKRGSGESGGSTWGVAYDGYARDAVAAMRFIASRPDLDPSRMALQGQSEAEWVLPIALAGGPPVRAVVLTSGSMMTPADQVLFNTAEQLRKRGHGEDIVRRAESLQRRLLQYQRSGVAAPALDADLRRSSREHWFRDAKLPDRLWPIEEYRWWRGVMDFDARPYWRRVSVPVLAFSGMRDEKTDWRHSQERLRALLREGGNKHFTGFLLPRTEHAMIVWCLGEHIPPPCWPEQFPSRLVEWLRRQFASAGSHREAPVQMDAGFDTPARGAGRRAPPTARPALFPGLVWKEGESGLSNGRAGVRAAYFAAVRLAAAESRDL